MKTKSKSIVKRKYKKQGKVKGSRKKKGSRKRQKGGTNPTIELKKNLGIGFHTFENNVYISDVKKYKYKGETPDPSEQLEEGYKILKVNNISLSDPETDIKKIKSEMVKGDTLILEYSTDKKEYEDHKLKSTDRLLKRIPVSPSPVRPSPVRPSPSLNLERNSTYV